MKVIDTIQYMADRLQIAMIVGSVPGDGSGDIAILYANTRAAELFGYEAGVDMLGQDVRTLMPPEIARVHREHVGGYMTQASEGTFMLRKSRLRADRIMGAWRNLKGVRLDGSLVDLQANVADIKNEDERYFVAIFRDRTSDVQREEDLQKALTEACASRAEAEKSAQEAESAKAEVEEALKKQNDLSKQVSLLLSNMTTFRTIAKDTEPQSTAWKTWTIATMALACVVVPLILFAGVESPTTLAEKVILVLSGALGAASIGALDFRKDR